MVKALAYVFHNLMFGFNSILSFFLNVHAITRGIELLNKRTHPMGCKEKVILSGLVNISDKLRDNKK